MQFNLGKLVLICLILSIVWSGSSLVASEGRSAQEEDFNFSKMNSQMGNKKILILIGNGFGYTYFDAKAYFETWGCNVTTAGLSGVVDACYNKPARNVTADVLISEIDRNQIREYDCLFIPSGGHHQILSLNQAVLNLVAMAYEEGLVVSTLCVSILVLVNVQNMLNGIKVIGHATAASAVEAAGGIIVPNARVVSDSHIITGGRGPSSSAPTYQLCVEIMKELLGYSYVLNTTLGQVNTNYTINVETTDLSDFFG
ncbi:MAG: DJ-1/PfpI family protein, partial [Candidatus Hodarchaeota archaeon]